MKIRIFSFISGLIFAIGLGISGMTQPAKVVAFLDVSGHWDPSLAFVMVGAIGVFAVAYRVAIKRGAPRFDTTFHMPSRRTIDSQLVTGAVLFGIGWGLSGYCPGPAIVSLVTGNRSVLVFVGAMLGGMMLYEWFEIARARRLVARSEYRHETNHVQA